MMVARVLLIAVSAWVMAGCSSPAGGGAEPPDFFAKLGLPPSTSPVRWIESASGTDETREYYQGLIGSSSSVEGGELDISDGAFLVLTRPAGSSSLRYELEVARSKYVKGATRDQLLKTVTSSGTATVETVPGRQGPLTVYRLDGGATPDQAYVLVRFGDELHRAAAKLEESEKVFQSLSYRASAAPQRVEITDGVDSVYGHKVRLRMGQELVARLDRGPAHITSTLLPASLGRVLQLVSATEESVGDVRAQVFRFTPLTPGWADVVFNSGAGDTVGGETEIRVKVE